MERTRKEQSLQTVSDTPKKLFDMEYLLEKINIPPIKMENMKCLPHLEGLTEGQIRLRGFDYHFVQTGLFGVHLCLCFLLYEDRKGYYLFLINDDRECFRALYFSKTVLN